MQNNTEFQCNICHRNYKSRGWLDNHNRRFHPQNNNDIPPLNIELSSDSEQELNIELNQDDDKNQDWDKDQLDLAFTAATASTKVLGIEELNSLPERFTIIPAYPNPFNPSTTIIYGLDKESSVNVQIYDINGKLISTLEEAEQHLGWHSVEWNGTDMNNNNVPAGMYLCKVTAGNDIKTIKLMLVK